MRSELSDSFGRIHRDLRISVTDRCDFRCSYCMPEEGLVWLDRSELLSFEEIDRIVSIMVENFGFESVRLTGGEPLVRARLVELIEMLSEHPIEISMTTNGASLKKHAFNLKQAGLHRVNISLDSLKAERFLDLTRRDRLSSVLEGIEAAKQAGFDPVKINAVVMRGVNDDEIIDFAAFGRQNGVQVRFIEWMPLDADNAWSKNKVVPQAEIIERINEVFPIEPVARTNAPAQKFRYLDGAGSIGVIATVSEAFCSSCDRVRMTAEGQFRNCLFAMKELDLRALLRSGASNSEIAAEIAASVQDKWAGHQINKVYFIRPSRSMSQIGG